MIEPMRIFIGYDHRQPVSYNTLQFSLIAHSSEPLAITPIVVDQVPITRHGEKLTSADWPDRPKRPEEFGLTPFSYSRFLVPYLSGYKGWSLFLDADMLAVADIAELFKLANDDYAVMVVKNKEHFEWASLMLFNNEKCRKLTPQYVDSADGLFKLRCFKPEEIGGLPPEWNHCVGYDEERESPKLIHYTMGVPAWEETNECEHAPIWHLHASGMSACMPWEILMGQSVHAAKIKPQEDSQYVAT